jgi:hypothetical protein
MRLPPSLLSGQHRSTPTDRARLRESLAWRFDSHVRAASRLIAQLPGLRPAGEPEEALLTDLAAVRAVLTGDRSVIDDALRGTRPAVDQSLLSCLTSGLLRLPTCRAPVYRSQPAGPAYRPGQLLVEPALATARLLAHPVPPGHVELVIWSTTGRRVEGLIGPDEADEVVFPAGNRFLVLATDLPATEVLASGVLASEPARVFLCEAPAGHGTDMELGEREERLLSRLRQSVADRAKPGSTPVPASHALGVDANGNAYPVETPGAATNR